MSENSYEQTVEQNQSVKRNYFYLNVASGLSVVYIAFLVFMLSTAEKSFFCMNLNEQGDFLAGGFAPLAFIWLVAGYLQQGQELHQHAEQMGKSVEQFKEANRLQEEEMKADMKVRVMEAMPDLAIRTASMARVNNGPEKHSYLHKIVITNGTKNIAENVRLRFNEEINLINGSLVKPRIGIGGKYYIQLIQDPVDAIINFELVFDVLQYRVIRYYQIEYKYMSENHRTATVTPKRKPDKRELIEG